MRLFLAVAWRRPGKAAEIAWWRITGRKRRAIWKLCDAAGRLPDAYAVWLKLYQGHGTHRTGKASGAGAPLFAIHLHLGPEHDPQAAAAAIRSAVGQSYPGWRLYITGAQGAAETADFADPRVRRLPGPFPTRAEAMAEVLSQTEARFLVPLDSDAVLDPGALGAYKSALAAQDAVCYADQDESGPDGARTNPWFKPRWDRHLFLAQDYLSAACVLPVAWARHAAPEPQLADEIAVYALIGRLTLAEGAAEPRHIPYVAVTTAPDAWRRQSTARAALVLDLAARHGEIATVEKGPFGTVIVRPNLPEAPPAVSVIVPTRDRLDLLETCVTGVLEKTSYPALELVIADNGSVEPETLAYFERMRSDPRVRVVAWPHPYNYSAINNFAAAEARGEYLCLLNNDTEIIAPDWLGEMMRHALRPETGAVGARLLYPDGSLQHAGVVVGLGRAAGHAHRGLPEHDPGYFAQAHVTRGAGAVTAACLVVAKRKFDAVGGLDAQGLAIAYNDVDLCLKLRAAGWRNLYVPQARLIHHESKSRGQDFSPEHRERYLRELALFQQRWNPASFTDPMHHPALDIRSEVYRLGFQSGLE